MDNSNNSFDKINQARVEKGFLPLTQKEIETAAEIINKFSKNIAENPVAKIKKIEKNEPMKTKKQTDWKPNNGWRCPSTMPKTGKAFMICTFGPQLDIAWFDSNTKEFKDYFHKQNIAPRNLFGWMPLPKSPTNLKSFKQRKWEKTNNPSQRLQSKWNRILYGDRNNAPRFK